MVFNGVVRRRWQQSSGTSKHQIYIYLRAISLVELSSCGPKHFRRFGYNIVRSSKFAMPSHRIRYGL